MPSPPSKASDPAPEAAAAPVVGKRMQYLVRSVLDVVPLAEALDVVSEYVREVNDNAAMLTTATLRGERAKPLIEARVGASLSTEEAGRRLRKSAETVRNWIEQDRLIAYRPIGDRTRIRLPAWQFDDRGGLHSRVVHSWVAPLISAYGANGWELLDFLTVPRSSSGGMSHLHRLLGGREPEIADVLAAARRADPE